jgi:hypothetical protein
VQVQYHGDTSLRNNQVLMIDSDLGYTWRLGMIGPILGRQLSGLLKTCKTGSNDLRHQVAMDPIDPGSGP